MPVFKIQHTTTYEYNRLVKESVNQIRIFPFQSPDQEVLQHDLTITQDPDIQLFYDYWGNKAGTFNLLSPHKELVVHSKLLIRTIQTGQIKVNFHSGFAELALETGNTMELLDLLQASKIKSQDEILKIIEAITINENSVAGTVETVCEYIYKYFKYEKGITTVETTVDEILSHRSGVCQDFVHLMLQLLRSIGIPCRYVSGYICPNKDGMRGEGATHAWVEAWIPSCGWAGIDPTNNVWVTNKHVKLASGRNFNDCTPVKGSFKGPALQKLSVFVAVGYEDGHSFEDRNNVRLAMPEEEEEMQFINNPDVQQQQ